MKPCELLFRFDLDVVACKCLHLIRNLFHWRNTPSHARTKGERLVRPDRLNNVRYGVKSQGIGVQLDHIVLPNILGNQEKSFPCSPSWTPAAFYLLNRYNPGRCEIGL